MRNKAAIVDAAVAVTAARQHGVVSIEQLAMAGIDRHAALRRVRAGRMHRVYRGVYAVGHPALTPEGRWMAAVLACGEGAVVSHGDGAALWELLRAHRGPVDVTVPGRGGRDKRLGIRLHRSPSLTPADVTRRRNIPVTTPARTIADLRRVLPAEQLRRAIRQAEVLGLPLGGEAEHPIERSELEHRFLRLCRRHRLPLPEVNVKVGPFVVDFLWRDQRVIVETDGYRFHRGRLAFEDDRRRDAELRRLGYEVVRFSYRQVIDEPALVVATLNTVLVEARRRLSRQPELVVATSMPCC